MTLRPSPFSRFLENLEIYLTAAGILVTFAIPLALRLPFWETIAITALAVSVIHGMIFWLVRRRQRKVRQELIVETKGMLKDRINSQLTVLLWMATDPDRPPLDAAAIQSALDAAQSISRTLDHLSLDSLSQWKDTYRASNAA